MRIINNKYMAEYVRSRYVKLKQQALEYKGWKCQVCGYSKCSAALVFHHRDPNQKEMGWNHLRKRSWKFIKEELDKCDLLCANCHSEEHYKPEIMRQAIELLKSRKRKLPTFDNNHCLYCGNELKRTKWGKHIKYCSSKCVHAATEKCKWPHHDELEKMVKEQGRVQIGKVLGVSETSVRKRLRTHLND